MKVQVKSNEVLIQTVKLVGLRSIKSVPKSGYTVICICHTSLIFMSKLSNAIGANSVTCRVLDCDVLQNKCSDWLNVMFTGEH